MGRTAIWAGDKLKDLLELDIEELCQKYPGEDRNKLRALRRYHRSKMEKEPTRRIVSESEYPAWIKNSEGEIETQDLVSRKYEYVYDEELDVNDLFPQIEASTIRATRRKQVKHIGSLALTYGDGQVAFRRIIDPQTEAMELLPTHDVEVHRIILQMNAHYMPSTTINGGDFADNPESSRFPADSDHFHKTMTPAYRWIHDFYSQMVADNPNAEHVEVDSNHAERIKKTVLKDVPQFYDFYRPGEDYPAWSYYSMANLGALGIKFVSGYKAAMYIHAGETGNPIGVHHGHTASSVPGATVRKEMAENPDMNIVRFHGHNYEMVMRTARDGRQLFYLQLPSSCLNDGPTPGYRNAIDDKNRPVQFYNPHHQKGFAFIKTSPDGNHQVDFIGVVGGKAWYDDILWDGTQPFEWEYKYGYVKKEETNE